MCWRRVWLPALAPGSRESWGRGCWRMSHPCCRAGLALASPQSLGTKVFSATGLLPLTYGEGKWEGEVFGMWLCHQLLMLGITVFIILCRAPGRREWGWMQFGGRTGLGSRVNTPALAAVFESTRLLRVLVSPFPPLGKQPVGGIHCRAMELHTGLCRDLFCSRPDARVVVTSCEYFSLETKCLEFSKALCTLGCHGAEPVHRNELCGIFGFAASGQNSHGEGDSEANAENLQISVPGGRSCV